jgi:hypothetical protein
MKQNFLLADTIVAIILAWTIVSFITGIILIWVFVADRQTILKYSPVCISKKQFNIECSLCGMTRAFIELRNGEVKKAVDLNKGSIFLFSSFILNFLIAIIYWITRFLRVKKLRIDDT